MLSIAMLYAELLTAKSELALVRHGQAVDGVVTGHGSHHEWGGDDDYWWVEYTYEVQGKAFAGRYTRYDDWRVPKRYLHTEARIALEYVPGDPSVSRPLGTGAGSMGAWVAKTLMLVAVVGGVGSVFLVVGLGIFYFQLVPVRRAVRSRPQLFAGRTHDPEPVVWEPPADWLATLAAQREVASGPGDPGD